MNSLQKKYKKEAIIGTILFHLLVLLFFITTGLTYVIPKPEQGIMLNMGGVNEEDLSFKQQNISREEEEQKKIKQLENEDILTQKNKKTININKKEKKVKQKHKNKKTVRKQDPSKKKKKKEKKPEVSKNLKNVLSKFKASKKKTHNSKNNNKNKGKKGTVNGSDVNTSGKTIGYEGNYKLGDRNAIIKPKPRYTCEEEGVVIIEIRVDKKGNTISAKATKGTNNYAECLVKEAIKSAKQTKWQPKADASPIQIGRISYHFVLN